MVLRNSLHNGIDKGKGMALHNKDKTKDKVVHGKDVVKDTLRWVASPRPASHSHRQDSNSSSPPPSPPRGSHGHDTTRPPPTTEENHSTVVMSSLNCQDLPGVHFDPVEGKTSHPYCEVRVGLRDT